MIGYSWSQHIAAAQNHLHSDGWQVIMRDITQNVIGYPTHPHVNNTLQTMSLDAALSEMLLMMDTRNIPDPLKMSSWDNLEMVVYNPSYDIVAKTYYYNNQHIHVWKLVEANNPYTINFASTFEFINKLYNMGYMVTVSRNNYQFGTRYITYLVQPQGNTQTTPFPISELTIRNI